MLGIAAHPSHSKLSLSPETMVQESVSSSCATFPERDLSP